MSISPDCSKARNETPLYAGFSFDLRKFVNTFTRHFLWSICSMSNAHFLRIAHLGA